MLSLSILLDLAVVVSVGAQGFVPVRPPRAGTAVVAIVGALRVEGDFDNDAWVNPELVIGRARCASKLGGHALYFDPRQKVILAFTPVFTKSDGGVLEIFDPIRCSRVWDDWASTGGVSHTHYSCHWWPKVEGTRLRFTVEILVNEDDGDEEHYRKLAREDCNEWLLDLKHARKPKWLAPPPQWDEYSQ
jgi:hypothetical protein